tara:strand:+ start:790 stop:1599 length:810 start_codon:yes stop_codon:yes gene_type:complete
MQDKNKESEWFGDKKVKADDKAGLVGDVFASVADNYDVMNDVMSGGIHRIWKNRFVRMVAPTAGNKILDVAGGTGDIAFRMHEKTAGRADITVYDINAEMLRNGRDRAIDRGILNGLTWTQGDAEKLPYPDNSFDIYTISFGLRNVTRIDDALAEAFRVLKPGGRFFCLEFSKVQNPLLAGAYDVYSRAFIPRFGELIAKDGDSYAYLIESIRKFPPQKELAARMQQVGFERVAYKNFSAGIAAVHSGYKLTQTKKDIEEKDESSNPKA